ncbi:RidA family protein [Parahaliea mediterranea]|uniref:RidA family protein n=1 Tax=Parahaliea mediterranea TaxID=651086 RepID=A0A939DH52_9GAMM|nr:RidA family protein [Parahaliea mediterranea]MBN7797382.1 RidA family protein [Parahaliea mediterranea]
MHISLLPEGWPRPKGYSNAILARGNETIFVGGQIGWNSDFVFESNDFTDQVKQALTNITDILASADAGPEHITRMTWYITDKQAYVNNLRGIGAAYREVMGKHFPAMSVVEVSALIEDEALVEIEVTAVK